LKKKFIFLVQGEGRGHMTQAIALSGMLRKNGHAIAAVFIGVSARREIPDYFLQQIGCAVTPLPSPNFVLDKNNKSLRLFASVFSNILKIRTCLRSLRTLHQMVQSTQPDILVNFYDMLGGIYFLLYRPPVAHVPVGHQFLAGHPSFPYASGRPMEKWLFKLNNRMMSISARKKIALSFTPYTPTETRDLVVVPPLMRDEVTKMAPADNGFILVYMVNDGYGEEIMRWHESNRSVALHCFWDRKGTPDELRVHENLTFHKISGAKFMEMMAGCSGYATTAGFESICEAMFLGKPILMIPVQSQYEQACNALDAEHAGAGIIADHFDISRLLDFMASYKPVSRSFGQWAAQAEKRIVLTMERLK
jgi:uncharacterized protein (TIGR00661 family)